nr:MAG TPA: hypothetical protein [Microviridae sp.]
MDSFVWIFVIVLQVCWIAFFFWFIWKCVCKLSSRK